MRADRPLPLPSVDPGQIWLIEHDPSAVLGALDRAVLSRANVVLYDRVLAALVSQALSIGAYAEPLPATVPLAGPAIAARALEFAIGGWSVVSSRSIYSSLPRSAPMLNSRFCRTWIRRSGVAWRLTTSGFVRISS